MPAHKAPLNSRKIAATAAGAVLVTAGVISGGVALSHEKSHEKSREKPSPVTEAASLSLPGRARDAQDKAARDLVRQALTPSATPTATPTATAIPTETRTPATTRAGARTRTARPTPARTATPQPEPTPARRSTGYGPTTLRADGSTCRASYYYQGQMTANGERFDPDAMTAAHKTLPFGSKVLVTNVRNGKSVIVRVNDRGPFVAGRCLDLSRGAFARIASLGSGVTTVEYEVLR